MALDADTGKVIWEYKFNLFQSDVPPHRIGWASPAADPETGNIYALSGGAQVIALSRDGKPLWDRSFGEEFAAFTTHGGRTMSPLVDGDLVIVSAAVSNWGTAANRAHRFIALDKRTGDVVYVANPGGRPYDTAYASPLIATINGMRLLIAGLGDGAIHAIKPQTGEKVWSFPAAKRAINTGVVGQRDDASSSRTATRTSRATELGLIAVHRRIADRRHQDDEVGAQGNRVRILLAADGRHASLSDRQQLDAEGVRHRDRQASCGTQPLGTAQKAPPVLADGKIYVGTDGGKFFIVRPLADRAEVLSEVELPNSTNSCCGSEGTPEQILGGAAVSRGRIFFVSSDAVYAIGSKQATSPYGIRRGRSRRRRPAQGAPAHLQVSPTELVLTPGQTVKLRARLFDDKGRFLREETAAAWSLEGLKGTVAERRVHGGERSGRAGRIDQGHGRRLDRPGARARRAPAAVEGNVRLVRGRRRARRDGSMPWPDRCRWRRSTDRRCCRRRRSTRSSSASARSSARSTWSNYTFEADVRAAERRRQMGDVGITAQRYSLVLYGTSQRLKIEPWEPETARTVTVPFAWKADTWYRLKLRVENLPNGQVRARGKAWPVGEAEPAAWMIDKTDPIGNRQGAPGLFIDAQFGAYLDNFTITQNQ